MINIYGPNDDNPSFYENVLTVSALEGLYIIGGDFNCTLDPGLDRSTQTDSTHTEARKILINYIQDLRINEVWRTKSKQQRIFMLFKFT